MGGIRIQHGAATEKGHNKEKNQDHYVCLGTECSQGTIGLYAVADGIGGLSGGEIASGIACSQLENWWKESDFRSVESFALGVKRLPELVADINQAVLRVGEDLGIHMGTTLCLMALYGGEALLLSIGDSRAYRFYKKGWFGVGMHVKQLTEDDSAAVLRRDSSGREYCKEVLTACLGREREVSAHVNRIAVKRGERYLLCSDGIYKKNRTISDMERLLEQFSMAEPNYCQRVVEAVKAQGETDDITMVCLRAD